MFEIVDGRTTDDGRRTDDGVTGILLAHPWAFRSGELKMKDTYFIFSMTNVIILGVFRTHAQKEYGKVLVMKSTYILNILALLFF